MEMVTVGSTIATGLDGRVGSWQSELLNMALTHAKASLVAMVTLDVMSGSLSVFRVGELAATCWTALLVSLLLSPALCRGALCAARLWLMCTYGVLGTNESQQGTVRLYWRCCSARW